MTVIRGDFEWDSEKEAANIRKHGLSFEDVLPAFEDPLFMEVEDELNSTLDETRWRGIGMINNFTVVLAVYTPREGRTRIVSARFATTEERNAYELWCRQFYR